MCCVSAKKRDPVGDIGTTVVLPISYYMIDKIYKKQKHKQYVKFDERTKSRRIFFFFIYNADNIWIVWRRGDLNRRRYSLSLSRAHVVRVR